MWIKPAPGLKVRNPLTMKLLPDTGIEVPDGDLRWNRLIAHGDVVKFTPPATPAPAAQKPAQAGPAGDQTQA